MSIIHDMSQRHEHDTAERFGGVVMPGSGNQWRARLDGRTDVYQRPWPWAWDCKATHGHSILVTRGMWVTLRSQSDGEHLMLPLRYYEGAPKSLRVGLDLAVVDVNDLVELTELYEAKVIECERLKAELEVPRG